MNLEPVAPFDFPPAGSATAKEVHDLLTANLFAEARHAVSVWSPGNRVRELIEAGLYQEAVSELASRLHFPNHVLRGEIEPLGNRNFRDVLRLARAE